MHDYPVSERRAENTAAHKRAALASVARLRAQRLVPPAGAPGAAPNTEHEEQEEWQSEANSFQRKVDVVLRRRGARVLPHLGARLNRGTSHGIEVNLE